MTTTGTQPTALQQTEPAGQAALQLTAVYAGYGRATVLRDVNATVARGSVVALLGSNGAGKTTLLRTASGLLKLSAGTVSIGGTDATRLPPNRRARHGLCLVPEGRGVFRSLTVRENLRLQIPSWNKSVSMDQVLELFPVLRTRLRQTAGTLSGGEQQMLAISRSYLASPAIVLLDEVSMGLAPKVVEQIFEALGRLAGAGTALLVVEQYITRALDMADRVILLERGRVTFSGTPDELQQDAILRGYFGADIGATAKGGQDEHGTVQGEPA
jgi:branched-chain amino acid transport system ATP-binding protein